MQAMTDIAYTGPANWEGLEAAAVQASLDHPGNYVLVVAFGFSGYHLHLHKRLPRDARSRVSNSGKLGGGYYLNGKRRTFTDKQIIADQQDWR